MEQLITVIRLILKWISDRVNNICSVRHVPDFKSKMWKTVFRLLLFDNETRCVCKTLCLPPSPPHWQPKRNERSFHKKSIHVYSYSNIDIAHHSSWWSRSNRLLYKQYIGQKLHAFQSSIYDKNNMPSNLRYMTKTIFPSNLWYTTICGI